MAHRKAWLTKRVKLDGVWRTAAPVLTQAGVPTEKVRAEGTTRVAPGTFVVEYYDGRGRRCRKTAGTNAIAFKQLRHLQRKLEDQADGHEVRFENASSKKRPFKVAVDDYVSELRDIRGLTEKSIRGIEQLLALFEVEYLEDLKKEDVIRGLMLAEVNSAEVGPKSRFGRQLARRQEIGQDADPALGCASCLIADVQAARASLMQSAGPQKSCANCQRPESSCL